MSKELYVGHLPYAFTEDDLKRLFSVAGTVTSVHIIRDPQSGKSKGCGYVRMWTSDAVREAIDCLDGAVVEGRLITVSEAKPQKELQKGGARKGAPGLSGGKRRGGRT